ncbi:hypothetical protein ACVW2K_001016 [Nocardioides sp. HB32]
MIDSRCPSSRTRTMAVRSAAPFLSISRAKFIDEPWNHRAPGISCAERTSVAFAPKSTPKYLATDSQNRAGSEADHACSSR